MHSGYEIPGIQQSTENNSYAPILLSMNQTHTLPATQQGLFIDQTLCLPPRHHYGGGGAPSSAYFLGLLNNEICSRNNDYSNKDGTNIDELRGSERYQVWQNQPISATNKQPPPLWEHQTMLEASTENGEIVDDVVSHEDHIPADDHHHHLRTCLDSKNRLHFGELEAIYKRLGTNTESKTNVQTGPCENNLPKRFDHGSEPKEASAHKKRKKENSYSRGLISPTAEFFGSLVKQVMDHQENMHKKFVQVIERLEEERKAREEDWRKQELERLEQESEARAREKASAKDREAMIVSYLEKITGERIRFDDFD
ncbi:hypothetical protein CASFOL_007127 [Castilleja foliolosa]|uniref:Uncharacterized protein n=1 Tax=Castilleja foliolosa TaxID=1961234 RepID=A0ABD3EC66_9LAMI